MNTSQKNQDDKSRKVMAYIILCLGIGSLIAAVALCFAEKDNSSMFVFMSVFFCIFAPVILTNKKLLQIQFLGSARL